MEEIDPTVSFLFLLVISYSFLKVKVFGKSKVISYLKNNQHYYSLFSHTTKVIPGSGSCPDYASFHGLSPLPSIIPRTFQPDSAAPPPFLIETELM